MADVVKEVNQQVVESPKEPGKLKIALWVCGCPWSLPIFYYTKRLERIAKILDLSPKEVLKHAMKASATRLPQVMGCYYPDIARTKLEELEQCGAFLYRCHLFFIQD